MEHKKTNVTIGIDVSKEKLDIFYFPTSAHKVIANNRREIGQWLRVLLKDYDVQVVALEPTGGYEKPLLEQLLKRSLNIELVHPNPLNHFQAVNREQAKTDKIASSQLARYAQCASYPHHYLSLDSLDETKRKELSSRIRQTKSLINQEKNRLEKPLYSPQVKKSLRRHIKYLENELRLQEKEIEALMDKNEALKSVYELIQTYKGAGKVTAQTLVLDVPELGKLSKAKISSLVGLAPINRDSGKKQGQRYIQGGRGQVRRVLYMAALVAIRHNLLARKFYERLREAGKPFKVAIVAVMRKILCTLNAMVRDNLAWKGNNKLPVLDA